MVNDQIPGHLNSVGEGWRGILMNLHRRLLDVDRFYVIDIVQEKFGILQVRLKSPEIDAIKNIIAQTEWCTERICERCGSPGKLCTVDREWKVRCPVCLSAAMADGKMVSSAPVVDDDD